MIVINEAVSTVGNWTVDFLLILKRGLGVLMRFLVVNLLALVLFVCQCWKTIGKIEIKSVLYSPNLYVWVFEIG